MNDADFIAEVADNGARVTYAGNAENRLEQETLARFGMTSGIDWEYHSDPQPFAVGRTWAGSDKEARSKVRELLIRLVSAKVSRGAGRLVVQGRLSGIDPHEGIVVIEVFTGERPDEARGTTP